MGIFDFLKKKKAEPSKKEEVSYRPAPVQAEKPKTVPNPIAPETKEPKAEQTSAAKEKTVPSSFAGERMKYHYDRVKVFTPKELNVDFTQLNPGDDVVLLQAHDNSYDPHAVAVCKEKRLGYLYKGKLYEMANDYLTAELPILAHIDSIDDDKQQLTVHLAFYGSTFGNGDSQRKTYKLTGTGSQKVQDMIALVDEEDELDIEYDESKEKYAVLSMGDVIGYLPKSAEQSAAGKCICCVDSLNENDNGKIEVEVYFPEE